MKLTVQTAVSDRPVETPALEPWVNREARPVLARLREAANFTGRERQEVVSAATGAATQIWESSELPQNCSWSIEARVTACPAATVAGYGDFCVHATIVSRAGVVSGNQFTRWANTNVAMPVPVFNVDTTARKASLTVADVAAKAYRFVALVDVQEALAP